MSSSFAETTVSRSATLAQLVADTLEQSLKDGVYGCGDRMPEITIAKEFNVSQNTVRDALASLELDGWVVKRQRHGVTVRSFTAEEVQELYMLRANLEKLALGWAMETITEIDKNHLAQIVSEARIQAGMSNVRGVREARFAFHAAVLTIAHKSQTARLLRVMHNQSRLLENIRAAHAPHRMSDYAAILTLYGDLVTEIRYDNAKAAQNTLYTIILDDCRSLLPVIDLVM